MGYSWGFNAIFMGIMIMWDLILEYTNLNQACLFHGHGYIYIYILFVSPYLHKVMVDVRPQWSILLGIYRLHGNQTVCHGKGPLIYIYIVIGCNWMYIIGKLHLKITVPEDMHDCTIIQSRHIHPHTMNIQPRTWSIPARTIDQNHDQNQFAGPGRTETTARGKGNVQPCLQRQNFDIIPMMFINGHNM